MARGKSPEKASGRENNWHKVFNTLVELSQKLQKDKKFLENRIKSLHGVMCKMKVEHEVESTRADLFLVSSEKEAAIYKHRYDSADSQLADLRQSFDYLSQKCEEPKDMPDDTSNKAEGSRNKSLQNEVRKLKGEIEKCKLDKNTEISALLAEKKFVWNQFEKMESNLTNEIKKKDDEVKRANEKVQLVLNRADELEASNEKLRTGLAKVETESSQKSEEIFRLLKEIENLKAKVGPTETPSLRSCRGGKSSNVDGGVIKVKKETNSSQTFEKMARTKPSAHKSTGGKAPRKQLTTKGSSSSSLKRKAVEVITIPDSPKLFNCTFKVPKLKSSAT
ncbi:hypothetical protein PHJA_001671100 [Phtheirospermum japonicum]|uniref:Uncharacterized protein n=1 Tax=Phtheirospermum japonicum TaxID=374723 RepID=A0A830CE02_9LAMI|nr:hypothetical protein PHJA_001671100 [Phtheirospermum japonicum]